MHEVLTGNGHQARLVVVSHNLMIAETFARALSQEHDLQIVGTATLFAEAMSLVDDMIPDMVVTGVRLPGGSGIELARRIKAAHCEMKAILLTDIHSEEIVMSCLEAGADAYVLLTSPYDSLVECIKLVQTGNQVYDAQAVSPVLRKVIQAMPLQTSRRGGNGRNVLSAREREVVHLIAKGLMSTGTEY